MDDPVDDHGPKQHAQHPPTRPAPDADPVSVHIDTPSLPAIHLRLHPITHAGSKAFIKAIPDIGSVLEDAVHTCWRILYDNEPHLYPRTIRSITVYVRVMEGIAYTTGSWLDGENKEIHFNAKYVERQKAERVRDEITGILIHEMVHVWQNNGLGTAPGGLIEGIADFVRLQAGFAPPHWKSGRGTRWDEGYEVTGYFLDWVEKNYHGFVRGVNAILRDAKWDVGIFKLITCKDVDELWKEYRKELGEEIPEGAANSSTQTE